RPVRLGHVLVDLAVREPGQTGRLDRDERLGLRRAGGGRERDGPLRNRERVDRRGLVGSRAHHLPTPTWTSRNRAPEQAWPTCAPWPGSPLPQFGVPSIT